MDRFIIIPDPKGVLRVNLRYVSFIRTTAEPNGMFCHTYYNKDKKAEWQRISSDPIPEGFR